MPRTSIATYAGDFSTPGIHRRFFWRVRHRFGANWGRMTSHQVAMEMRMVSNRRP